MNRLIIIAHPSKYGFSHRVAQSYLEAAKNKGDKVEIMNLYDKNWKQDFLTFQHIKDAPADKIRDKVQAKIKWADELVFIAPIWWMDVPAILKNFFDMNMTPQFAYRYVNGKQEGLLTDKTAKFFLTCDAPLWVFMALFNAPYLLWRFGRLGFCGIRLKKWMYLTQMRKKTEKDKESLLKKIASLA